MKPHADVERMTVRELVTAAHAIGRIRVPGGDDRLLALLAEADRRQRGSLPKVAGGCTDQPEASR